MKKIKTILKNYKNQKNDIQVKVFNKIMSLRNAPYAELAVRIFANNLKVPGVFRIEKSKKELSKSISEIARKEINRYLEINARKLAEEKGRKAGKEIQQLCKQIKAAKTVEAWKKINFAKGRNIKSKVERKLDGCLETQHGRLEFGKIFQ